MEKTASQIQKERIKELEAKAVWLIARCDVAALTSVNEKGYPRTCVLSIAKAEGFSDVYFVTSKRSALNGKAAHFEANPKAGVCYFLGGDSVTLIGNVILAALHSLGYNKKGGGICEGLFMRRKFTAV